MRSQEEELVNACLEVIRAHKSAQDLADELEPVLADEAEDFVIKVRCECLAGPGSFRCRFGGF